MNEELERILKMVENGQLDRAQAAELIAALNTAADPAEPTSEADEASTPKTQGRSRDRSRHRHRGPRSGKSQHRSRRSSYGSKTKNGRKTEGGDSIERAIDELGQELQNAIDLGSRTLKRALKQSVRLESWIDDSNRSAFSRAESPVGEDYTCTENSFTVSQVRGVTLRKASFCGNELNAAALTDLEIVDGSFNGQQMRGSSLRHLLAEDSHVLANQLNGAQLTRVTLAGGRLDGNTFNGAQIRDLGLAQSGIEDSGINAVRLKHLVLRGGSHVKGLALNGVAGRDWLLDAALVDSLEISGQRVDGLALRNTGLDHCSFRTDDWAQRFERRDLGLIRDLQMDHVVLEECHFIDCRFDRTSIRDVRVTGLTFEGVDFSGMTLSQEADFIQLASDRVA